MKQIIPSIIWLISIVIWLVLVLWAGLVRTAAAAGTRLRSVLRRDKLLHARRSSIHDAPVDLGRETRG